MGLDIFIETKNGNHENYYEISRGFCYQISLLDEPDQSAKYPLEIQQVYTLYNLEYSILKQMNTYRFRQQFMSEENVPQEKLDEIQAGLSKAFQPSDQLKNNLKTLYSRISENPNLLNQIQLNHVWIKKYFDRFHENIGEHLVDRNFGWDLRGIIHYLEKLPDGTLIRFGYV
ncbi:MAG: hypothetical protein HWE22_13625 [Flavobacteriales bacterium]|nr:hypothetical protein [Flavobacteriales bacterium]